MTYRCEAAHLGGFIQQLMCGYVMHGHFFYNACVAAKGTDLREMDRKIIDAYGLDITRSARRWRRKKGLGSIQYIRHGRFYVILATEDDSVFRGREPAQDIRVEPLIYAGYRLTYRQGHDRSWHPCVSIERGRYDKLCRRFDQLALRRTSEELVKEFLAIHYLRYAPVRKAIGGIWKAANERRRVAGLPKIPVDALRIGRPIFRPFVEEEHPGVERAA